MPPQNNNLVKQFHVLFYLLCSYIFLTTNFGGPKVMRALLNVTKAVTISEESATGLAVDFERSRICWVYEGRCRPLACNTA